MSERTGIRKTLETLADDWVRVLLDDKKRKIRILHKNKHGLHYEFRWSKSQKHFVGYLLDNGVRSRQGSRQYFRPLKYAKVVLDTEAEARCFVRGYRNMDSVRPRQKKATA